MRHETLARLNARPSPMVADLHRNRLSRHNLRPRPFRIRAVHCPTAAAETCINGGKEVVYTSLRWITGYAGTHCSENAVDRKISKIACHGAIVLTVRQK